MNELFSVLGIAGGILCAIGDLFLDLKGKGNRKLGTSGIIDSNWVNMAYWRFGISILFAFAGAALLGFGFFSLAAQIADGHRELALATGICGYVSALAAFFVHSVLCIQAIIYKKLWRLTTSRWRMIRWKPTTRRSSHLLHWAGCSCWPQPCA